MNLNKILRTNVSVSIASSIKGVNSLKDVFKDGKSFALGDNMSVLNMLIQTNIILFSKVKKPKTSFDFVFNYEKVLGKYEFLTFLLKD